MSKARLASVSEMESPHFRDLCANMGTEVRYCRRWEYPWVICQMWGNLAARNGHLLDIGSADSPIGSFISEHIGCTVQKIDIDPRFEANGCLIVKDEHLPFDDGTFDWVTSFSVIEHQPNRMLAIDEIVRVLKPGGFLGITFDVCESSMGMSYPHLTGRAYRLVEFQEEIWTHPSFGGEDQEMPVWNLEDIPAFLKWHKTTAPHHTYVVGGAILQKI